ncbi:MAG: 1-acyl-sn-glycerol-3-phosphate acyltransferase [Flavobacteriaceae bacterium]|nr:1-acyl-sn-glycerol-3-phosphate acyltransferase [Flavobacteriaceae bacterium]
MFLYKFIFHKLLGWKIEGDLHQDLKKSLIIVVPHTSWHDFYVGVFTRKLSGTQINFVGKKELFTWPFGYYFRWMGGAALDRSKNQNKVDAIAKIFNENKEFRLAMAPEGTRKKVDAWRTGYYYIAQKANIPLVPVAFDWEHKTVRIFDKFDITNDIEKDTAFLRSLFKGIKGKKPENT